MNVCGRQFQTNSTRTAYYKRDKVLFSMIIMAVDMWILFPPKIWKCELSNLINSQM
jgi:hypothetical protein